MCFEFLHLSIYVFSHLSTWEYLKKTGRDKTEFVKISDVSADCGNCIFEYTGFIYFLRGICNPEVIVSSV